MQIVSLKIRILWVVGLFFAALTTAVYATPKPAMGIALEDSKGITRQYRCMEVESHSGALADASSDNAAVDSMTNQRPAALGIAGSAKMRQELPGGTVDLKGGTNDVFIPSKDGVSEATSGANMKFIDESLGRQ